MNLRRPFRLVAGGPRRVVCTLIVAVAASVMIPIVTALRIDRSYWTGHHVGNRFDPTSDPRGWIDVKRCIWYSEAWFIPATEYTESRVKSAGVVDESATAIPFDRLPAWIERPRDVIGAVWSSSQHANYDVRCTAFGFPFRSTYGIVATNEEIPPGGRDFFSRYLVFDIDRMPTLARAVFKTWALSPVPDQRWIPFGVLPTGATLNIFVLWSVVYATTTGTVLLYRHIRRVLLLRAGRCPYCGYSISEFRADESRSRICPECGLLTPNPTKM